MPVFVSEGSSTLNLSIPSAGPMSERLDIGFVNNMAPAAQRATEIMFMSVLREAAPDLDVNVKSFSTRRSDDSGEDAESIAALFATKLDALIVTGAEPRASSFRQEPNWLTLTRVIDWAARNTITTFWSCLAAHAAVLHLDSLARRPLAQKRSGIFESVRSGPHALLQGLPERIEIPHSRQNSLDAEALGALDYRVLTYLRSGDADLFVRNVGSLFVFSQGHPEYEATTLLREYRRDVRRYLERERDIYPEAPQFYFDAQTEVLMQAFRVRASALRDPSLMAAFPDNGLEGRLVPRWRPAAVGLWRNWLSYIVSEKAKSRRVEIPFVDATRTAPTASHAENIL